VWDVPADVISAKGPSILGSNQSHHRTNKPDVRGLVYPRKTFNSYMRKDTMSALNQLLTA